MARPTTNEYHVAQGDPCRLCGKSISVHRSPHVGRRLATRKTKPTAPSHEPKGDPCKTCGRAAKAHVFHKRHVPEGDPCTRCGHPASIHIIPKHHKPKGDPCTWCGQPALNHAMLKYHDPIGDPCTVPGCGEPAYAHVKKRVLDDGLIWIGLDGEGQDAPHEGPGRGDHKYVFLGAARHSKHKKRWGVSNYKGLSTVECLEFIYSLHSGNNRVRFFTFGFGYDLTMILKDLDDKSLYELFRPELRQRPPAEAMKGPYPVRWGDYTFNLQGSKFSFNRKDSKLPNIVIWDIFKFYGVRFTEALKNWKVGSEELLERMENMKDQRGDFDKLSKREVQDYCHEECECMAELAEKLFDAHKTAGLRLTAFYGAGSTAAAMLKKMGIKEKIVDGPPQMRNAITCSFSGGRFENRWIGMAHGPIYNYDIASAYPYQLCFLPCLVHGKWVLTKDRKRIDKARAALVRYSLVPTKRKYSWGPFPFREDTGNICYPASSGGGWAWQQEYKQAEKMFPNIVFREAWVLDQTCSCRPPFEDIPHYYRERVRIGKDGPGIVMKLGMNSSYGKTVQSVGNGQFRSWIWGAMITSGCRAQILEIMAKHKDRKNLLMVATDGIYTREKLHEDGDGKFIQSMQPRDTQTGVTGKPLGCWEIGEPHEAVFCARPGIYFPNNPTKKAMDKIRARGIGRKAVLNHWKKLVKSFEKHGATKKVKLPSIARFCGAKTSISRSGKKPNYAYKRSAAPLLLPGFGLRGQKPTYGNWIEREVFMDFNPMPKREGIASDGHSLKIRTIPQNQFSAPYSKAALMYNAEAIAIREQQDMLNEQPDLDPGLFDLDEG